MIEKMKYINIMGKMEDIDYTIEKYVSNYDIHLENTMQKLRDEKNLKPIQYINPYGDYLRKAENFVDAIKISKRKKKKLQGISKEEAIQTIDYTSKYFEEITKEINELKITKEKYKKIIEEYEPFINLAFDVCKLKDLEFIKYQFGKMPITSYKQFEAFLYKDENIIFVTGKKDREYQWGVYFMADFMKDKVDSIFSSLHFQKLNFSLNLEGDTCNGTPLDTFNEYTKKLEDIEDKIEALRAKGMEDAHIDKNVKVDKNKIIAAYNKISKLYIAYDTRRYAAQTENNFFIMVGWMEEKSADSLNNAVNDDEKVILMVDDCNPETNTDPPVKLRNPLWAKPFEFFTKMYGLPSYYEIDPTPFIAITYTLLFGVMFADVGQGLVLSLLGFFLSRKKGLALGKILTVIGISSAIFGSLFGSVFGFEFKSILPSPAEGENSMIFLLSAVVLGIFMIFIAMLINIFNNLKRKEFKKILFDPNGISGFILYGGAIALIYLTLIKQISIPMPIIILIVFIPLILIFLKEPLLQILEKQKVQIHGGLGLFIFEGIIDLFEILLSYFTNTLSFVRVGAFVLSHASMMTVVLMLSGHFNGNTNIFVIIFGNILVMALEGLIVGIQVLRIEFYEMFSRFYKGDGKEFKPYKEHNLVK